MIIFERIASPFVFSQPCSCLGGLFGLCAYDWVWLVPKRGDVGLLHILQTCQKGSGETSVPLTWQGAGEQQILHVELVGFVQPKYCAGICQFDVLGEEGKGKKDFPKYCVRTVLKSSKMSVFDCSERGEQNLGQGLWWALHFSQIPS